MMRLRRGQLQHWLCPISILAISWCSMSFGASFPTALDGVNPGNRVTYLRKGQGFWLHTDAAVFDGSVKTTTSEKPTLDRRADLFADTGISIAASGKLQLAVHVRTAFSKRRVAELPSSFLDEQRTVIRPGATMIYTTPSGLNVFMGANHVMSEAYTSSATTETADSITSFGAVAVNTPFFGAIKEGSSWSGAFYYLQGGEGTRQFSKESNLGDAITGSTVFHEPSKAGLLVTLGQSILADIELALIFAGEGGQRTEAGKSVREDHLFGKLGGRVPMALGLGYGEVSYHSQSYSSNSFVDLDTIPLVKGRCGILFGSPTDHLDVGVVVLYGRDRQSIPEFNATYQVWAYGVRMGWVISL